MSVNNVKIRMYRHGFGDCFLLQFFTGAKRNFTMLIDCGLKYGDKVAGITLKDVEEDIKNELKQNKNTTANAELDVLVITHEHWDHVSGFHPKENLFTGISIGKIWMAWTESPDDKEAVLIRKQINKSVKALKLASAKLKAAKSSATGFYDTHINGDQMAMAQQKFNETLLTVTEFFGPLGLKTNAGISIQSKYKISLNTLEAMDRVKSLASGTAGIQYFYPGDLIKLPAKLPGIRIYVLGPPQNALLNKDKPSSGAKKEVYFGLDNYAMRGFVDGLLAQNGEHSESGDDGSPFADVTSYPETQAKGYPFFANSYFHKDNSWREIGDDWLNMSGALAMQLDNDTNNTSLALAIEFVETGKVLLFPGDAQVGNWLSWHDLEWEIKTGITKEKITATKLLGNTVFYKAGHHLSHNATLKKLGLELMKSDELVTFIPEKHDQYNGIPYDPLVQQIKNKTRGRFLFSADANYPAEKMLTHKPASLSKDEWESFKKSLKITKLFVELTIHA